MITLIEVVIGGFCLLGGFTLIVRGVGGNAATGEAEFLGIKIKLSRVGPGVIFALFGLILVIWGANNQETSVNG